MKTIRLLCAVSILALNAVACGDDTETSNNSGNADATAYITSCKKLCDGQIAGNCSAYSTADECKTECDASSAATGDCAAKLKAAGVCTDSKTDACTAESDCATEIAAFMTACQ